MRQGRYVHELVQLTRRRGGQGRGGHVSCATVSMVVRLGLGGVGLPRESSAPTIVVVNKARRGVGKCGLSRRVSWRDPEEARHEATLTWHHCQDGSSETDRQPSWQQGMSRGHPSH